MACALYYPPAKASIHLELVQFYGNDLLRWLIEGVDVVPDDHALARVKGIVSLQPPRLEQAH